MLLYLTGTLTSQKMSLFIDVTAIMTVKMVFPPFVGKETDAGLYLVLP